MDSTVSRCCPYGAVVLQVLLVRDRLQMRWVDAHCVMALMVDNESFLDWTVFYHPGHSVSADALLGSWPIPSAVAIEAITPSPCPAFFRVGFFDPYAEHRFVRGCDFWMVYNSHVSLLSQVGHSPRIVDAIARAYFLWHEKSHMQRTCGLRILKNGPLVATCGYYFNTLPECSPITFGNLFAGPLGMAVGAGDFPVFGWRNGFALAVPYPGCECWYSFPVFAWGVFVAA